jgi:hypothetical protein
VYSRSAAPTMVDSPPPLVPPLPAPPEEPGPDVGSEAWQTAQDIKSKRRNHGAGVGFVTDQKIRQFYLEMSFKDKIDEEDTTTTQNLHGLHREFIEKLLSVTEGDTHVMPTAKVNPNEVTSTCDPIVSIDTFPTSDRLHRKFFSRVIYLHAHNKQTVVRIKHEVLMKETVKEAKTKLFDWLLTKRIFMKHGELDTVETSSIGWLLGAHTTLVFKPTVAARLNQAIAQLPTDVLTTQIGRFGFKEDLVTLPRLFVNSKMQAFGAPPGRVLTSTLTISCINNRIRLMKELLSLVPPAELAYTFIPIGLATMESPAVYQKYMMINNDRQNEVQGLVVRGFSNEFLTRAMDIEDEDSISVGEYVVEHPSVVSIQETHHTKEQGKFIIIVLKEGYQDARTLLSNICETQFNKIYTTQEQRDNYRVTYKALPHLSDSPTAGGAAASHSANLAAMLTTEETKNGRKYSVTPSNSWAHVVAPRFSFDKNSKHPNARRSSDAASQDASQAKNVTTQDDNTNDAQSLASTGSTLAQGTQATSSKQTVMSQDLSSVVSRMDSMASEQSKLFERLFAQQDKQSRRAAREAKETRALHAKMMDLMMMLMTDEKNRPSSTDTVVTSTPTKPNTKKNEKKDGRVSKSTKPVPQSKHAKDDEDAEMHDVDDTLPEDTGVADNKRARDDDDDDEDDAENEGDEDEEDTEEDDADDDDSEEKTDDDDSTDNDGNVVEDDNHEDADAGDDEDDANDDDEEDSDPRDETMECQATLEDSDAEKAVDDNSTNSNDSDGSYKSAHAGDGDYDSMDTEAIDQMLETKHEKATKLAQLPPASKKNATAPPVTPTKALPSQKTRSEEEVNNWAIVQAKRTRNRKSKSSSSGTMSPSEAAKHAAAAIAAKAEALKIRNEKKKLLAAPPAQNEQSSNTPTPSTPSKKPKATNSSNPRSPSTPQAKSSLPRAATSSSKTKSRPRSPGYTPPNETKIQRTGTAPTAPTSLAEIARTLNFSDNSATATTIPAAPDPVELTRGTRLE